ncbi:dTDP-4-amino-4,6-dideoxygalactose transaminase [Clostridium tetanomorphum]|uniref:DegT/DnrJ/EryC1/StrS family aminotransferase n=1 Tax=Clostridium tetanomorphum TaxID=1553 RepID=A0A923E565_CLOTT|nr:DegT/DnrJ/EryC1/StrS family aminotransferase [Clostridium tetanomorphum]KAJ53384.1 pleiotropic regulatory protein [Clostridium tetanomorphum DSM 665]MBC2396630.1 DegT/DnrJ/EryC1/StrS family aminotransferase [Clostridium tetanomorphum]MBP1863960.1 dTDP-4-amino-4,6-dideoxygalactose transaminase [Clostridium tetanomorphum]NRS85038.1 dTDP-4-amino-4,6-dideoxygalactose transaminase [Clostridium tetanomorphum]NRZ98254.1 dTDP-4-amino-4,6-dideoxygalactose transaminase [Clostridium tetanomorphum]
MEVGFYTSKREYLEKKNEFNQAIENVLQNGIQTLGKEVKELEKAVEEFSGAKHAVGVASGTDALVMASDIMGFKNGKEVVTSPFTFLASTSCIAKHGGKPVFVDIDEETFNIDTTKIEEKITKNTVGIIPIHLFCQMANMDDIMKYAEKYNLFVLEDAAEAFGMKWKGNGEIYRTAGTIGHMGIYSFFPTKTLGGYGDGGIITTNSDKLAELSKIYRVHGAKVKYNYDYIGYNSRLDTIQAAILLVKMKYINEAIEKREVISNWYKDRLKDIEYVKIPKIKGEQKPVYYVFNLSCEKRDDLNRYLKDNGVGTSIYYPIPLHLQNCFSYLGYKKGDFPIAEKACNEVLALPIYPEITEDEVEYVCEKIKEFYKK